MAKEEVIGSPRKNLVFETVGSIRVKVGDKYYKLNYDKEVDEDEEDESSLESKIIITDDILLYETGQYEYPGDKKIIFSLAGGIYYTLDGNYYNFNEVQNADTSVTSDVIFENTVIFKGNPPFRLDSSNLISNLNAQYLEGHGWNDILALITDKDISFDTLQTTDGKFLAEDGKVTCETLICDKATIKDLSFEKLSGNITVSGSINVTAGELFLDGKLYDVGINILALLYKLYSVKGVDTDKTSFVDFAKELVKPVNSDYSWQTPSTYATYPWAFDRQILSDNLYWEPVDIESWKDIWCVPLSVANTFYIDPEEMSEDIEITETAENLKRSSTLYNEIITKIYLLTEDEKLIFTGSVLRLSIDSGFVSPETQGELIMVETTKNDDDTEIYESYKTKFIITGVGDNEVYVHTLENIKKESYLTLTSESVGLYEYVPYNENVSDEDAGEITPFVTFTVQHYSEPASPSEYDKLYLDVDLESVNLYATTDTIIGDLSTLDSVDKFAYLLSPSGAGIYSNNCFLRCPVIAYNSLGEFKNYIKLTSSEDSFIGLNDKGENWININNTGKGSITTTTYSINSDGEINIGDWLNVEKLSVGPDEFVRCSLKRGDMYRIDNYNSLCKFGPLEIQEDGSATLGKGETQITISASGEVKIPSAAIIK